MIEFLAVAIPFYCLCVVGVWVIHIFRELPTPTSRPPVRNPPEPEQ